MAAKLEWEWEMQHAFGARLMLGRWVLAETYRSGRGVTRVFKYSLKGATVTESEPYESLWGCAVDCEAEVRRLLKAAGVEVA